MGIDYTGLEAILISQKYVTSKLNLLTLARQGIHIPINTFNGLLNKYNLQLNNYHDKYCEKFFKELNFKNIESIDNSNYENCSMVHDLNKPVPDNLKERYDYILDGGTIEHIFNTPQVCENIIDLLSVGGIFCSITTNNNFSGHGIYQFSPEFFLSAFSEKYGMEVLEIYIAKVNDSFDKWINVKSFNPTGNGRNNSNFNTNDEVYIITIAKKIKSERMSLITNSPQQYSYENINWKN